MTKANYELLSTNTITVNLHLNSMEKLLKEIRSCTLCEKHLVNGVNPILGADKNCRLLIVSQAPGRVAHENSIPWNDKSGETLRDWMGIDHEKFYSKEVIGFLPMSFCFPGHGKTGDLPPRKECAPLWHPKLIELMPQVKLILLVGQYAQIHYLKAGRKPTLTETVRSFDNYLPAYFPLPHPSGRNNIWQAKNSWFRENVLPVLKMEVAEIFADSRIKLKKQ